MTSSFVPRRIADPFRCVVLDSGTSVVSITRTVRPSITLTGAHCPTPSICPGRGSKADGMRSRSMGSCLPYRYEEPVEDLSGGGSKSGRECVMSGNRTTQVRVGWDLGCCCLHCLLAYDAPRHPVCPRSRGWGIFGGRSREGDEGKPIERHTEPVGRDSDEDRTSTSPRPVSLRLVCGEPSYLALRLSAVTPAPSAVSRLPSDRCDDVPWLPFCFDRPQATCRGGVSLDASSSISMGSREQREQREQRERGLWHSPNDLSGSEGRHRAP